jgi:hypothetical protein
VVESFHEFAELLEMVDEGGQGEEEVMWMEEKSALVQDSE